MVVEATGCEICPHRVLITGDGWLKWFQEHDHQTAAHRVPEVSPWACYAGFVSYHTQNFTPARKAAQEAPTLACLMTCESRPGHRKHAVYSGSGTLGGATLP